MEHAGDGAGVEVVRGEVALGVLVGGHDQDDALRKHRVLADRALEDDLLVTEPLQRHIALDLLLDVPWRVDDLAPATDQRLEVLDVRHEAEATGARTTWSRSSPAEGCVSIFARDAPQARDGIGGAQGT